MASKVRVIQPYLISNTIKTQRSLLLFINNLQNHKSNIFLPLILPLIVEVIWIKSHQKEKYELCVDCNSRSHSSTLNLLSISQYVNYLYYYFILLSLSHLITWSIFVSIKDNMKLANLQCSSTYHRKAWENNVENQTKGVVIFVFIDSDDCYGFI